MIDLFNSLSESDLKKFYLFIDSPYFNTEYKVKLLYNYLRKLHPNIRKEHLARKELSLIVYYRHDASSSRIRKLLSLFERLLDMFIIQSETEKNLLSGKMAILQASKSRNDIRKWKRVLKDIVSIHNKMKVKDEKYYECSINIFNEQFEFDAFKGNVRSDKLLNCIDNINLYFIYQSLLAYSTYLINFIRKEEYLNAGSSMFREAADFTERNLSDLKKSHPGITVYYYITKMFFTFDDRYYTVLVKYYDSSKRSFDYKLKEDYHIFILVYYFKKILNVIGDELHNRKKLFELSDKIFFRTAYYKDYLSEGKFLNSYQFFLILKNALFLNELTWADKFMKKYNIYLFPHEREATVINASAIIKYFNSDYESSLKILAGINLSDWRQLIEMKMLKLLIWTETDKPDAFQAELSSFIKTLGSNKKIFSTVKIQLKTFLSYLKKIHKIRNTDDRIYKGEILKLKEALMNESVFTDYKFRLAELLNSRGRSDY